MLKNVRVRSGNLAFLATPTRFARKWVICYLALCEVVCAVVLPNWSRGETSMASGGEDDAKTKILRGFKL